MIQAARGQASHFTASAPIYQIRYGLMGIWALTLIAARFDQSAQLVPRNNHIHLIEKSIPARLLGVNIKTQTRKSLLAHGYTLNRFEPH